MTNTKEQAADGLNSEFMFQGTATELLLKAAKREIDLTQVARRELANRGLGVHGEWIGFDAAANYWTSREWVLNAEGKRVAVTIPESE